MNITPCFVAIALGVVFYILSRKPSRVGMDLYRDTGRALLVSGILWLLYALVTHPHGMSMGSSFRGVFQ
jgi:hypothetical protein